MESEERIEKEDDMKNQGESGEQDQEEKKEENQDEYEEVEVETEEDIPEEEIQKQKEEKPDEEVITRRKVKKMVKRKKEVEKVDEEEEMRRQEMEEKNRILDFFNERLEDYLDQYAPEYWTQEVKDTLLQYAENEYKMNIFVWIEKQQLRFDYDPPNLQHLGKFEADFVYMIKMKPIEGSLKMKGQDIGDNVISGVVKGQYLKGLLQQMNNQFIPNFMKENQWPENVKKEFLGQLHKFMSYLTDCAHQNEGYTELYIPNEDLDDLEQAQQDKDLIQRLEATLIHWYSQIKEVVNNQDSQQDSENAGPLDEINYWRSRKNNLSHIDEQLEKNELKRIIEILRVVDSSYIVSFQELTEKIKVGSIEAEDNLVFLKSLAEPCKLLQESDPKEIPKLLPDLLNRVRMIWEKSKYYYKDSRIAGLLHQISNEIIKRCKAKIEVKDMLDGDVEKCISDLQDSIECGRKWRQIYEKTAAIITKKQSEQSDRKWDFSVNSIFAQLDAFVQRCIELKEICEGQIQFARKGSDNNIPELGGSRGQEFINILEEIKLTFRKNLEKIRGSDQDKILDVKASKWLDQFNSFKSQMKDLDVMFKNVIIGCFNKMSTIQQGVQLLEAFDYLAKREGIKAEVRKQAQLVIKRFNEEMDQIKNEFDNMNKNMIQIPISHGKYSGQAIYVKSLMSRMEKQKYYIDKLTFIDENLSHDCKTKYDIYYQTFRQFIVNGKYKEWKDENKEYEDQPINKKLEQPILMRIEQNQSNKIPILSIQSGHLESNFDKGVYKLIKETVQWKKLSSEGAGPPIYADELVTTHKENLRVLRDYVMLVVRDYNSIIDSMDETEKKLFKKHLEETKMIINPGLLKLKWSSKGILEGFVRDCRKKCRELSDILKMYKNNRIKIQEKCQEIQVQKLIKIDKKRSYEIKYFEDEQERYRKDVLVKLRQYLEEIRKILSETYEAFVFKGSDIQQVWFKNVVSRIDMEIEEALKKSVKMSLLQLLQVIGDEEGKIKPCGIFKLSVELENSQILFKPSTEHLLNVMRQTTTAMVELLSEFKRMEHLMFEERKKKIEEAVMEQEKEQNKGQGGMRAPGKKNAKLDLVALQQFDEEYEKQKKLASFYERISDDHDVDKYTDKILANLRLTTQSLGECLEVFKKRESHYQNPQTKEKFARNLIEKNEPVSHLKSQIERFSFISQELNMHKSTDQKGCIVLDNTNIKSALVNVMQSWENTFLKAIEEKTCGELTNLYHEMHMSTQSLRPIPQDHQQLKKNSDLLQRLVKEKSMKEQQLGPLEEKFKMLDDYSIGLSEEFVLKRRNLREKWSEFCEMLGEIEERNQKVSKDMYYDTNKNLDNFFKETSDFKGHFIGLAPFSMANVDCEKAFQVLNEYRENSKKLRKDEEKMRFGLQLFDISYQSSVDLEYVEQEIVLLESVWKQVESWEKQYDDFKQIRFNQVDIEQLDGEVDDVQRIIKAYKNEVKKWDVVVGFKNNLEAFKNSLPLIKSLKERYMRERHWKNLARNFGVEVNPIEDTELLLKEVFELNILQHADVIRDIYEVAREEFKIENALDKIEQKWDNFDIELDPYKKGYKLKKSDDIFAVLEEHMSVLSAQKTTLFYEQFKPQIELWENILQQIMETLEMLQQVQRQWLYLESIFASQQNDQDKQLIGDKNKFQNVSNRFNHHMQRLFDSKNIRKSLTYEGFMSDLTDISKKLDESQKILLSLLEQKRSEFPRFYFVSSDELFELLGNSKDPSKVNKHIRKCFEGVNKLKIDNQVQPGRKNVESYFVSKLIAADNEQIVLNMNVQCEQGIETWLKGVEKQMKETLKTILFKTQTSMKSKEKKWIQDWISKNPGQLILTACQIQWTTECQSTLINIQSNEKLDKNKAWRGVVVDKKQFIDELTRLVRQESMREFRSKIISLITVEVHNRDIIDQLMKTCTGTSSFEWQKQLKFRVYNQSEGLDCQVEQTNTVNQYGFEYQGNNGRLVVTSLTDRCYLTLTTAMHLRRGGAPQGPAGTGKTETVKDLGKTLAKLVQVYNCSEGQEPQSLAKIFSGLIQSGAWGCFDEFNRITLEVLSVVSQQIFLILNALKLYNPQNYIAFRFDSDKHIQINPSCAIFITMNPGYAGRSELPDNLKSLFRPMSMMVPQNDIICEITLMSQGFKYGKLLSVKVVTLYNLMSQQFSKQFHYDFQLRAILSVLNNAGNIKSQKVPIEQNFKDKDKEREMEQEEQNEETSILMTAIRNINLPKLVNEDIALFNNLLSDLFPNVDVPDDEDAEFIKAVEREMVKMELQYHPALIQKTIQLYEAKKTRHGNMLVGKTLVGKSTVWNLLKNTLKSLKNDKPNKYNNVQVEVLNPKSVTNMELFGWMDMISMEWNEGVLSSQMAKVCKMESKDERWLILDGPVDTYWIENMNTVLDDNKFLTLLNGDRIMMPTEVGILIEVDDLSNASPATISRCGMIFIDEADLGWVPYAASWIDRKYDPEVKEYLADLFEKWFPRMIRVKQSLCQELIKQNEVAQVQSFCKMFDAFSKQEQGYINLNIEPGKVKGDNYNSLIEKWFCFIMIWTLGASVNEEGRNQFDFALREIDQLFPSQGTVYDYCINNEKNEWELWEVKLGQAIYKPSQNIPFHKMFVPTIDTTRNRIIISTCIKYKIPVLAVGTTGTGKTSLLNGILLELDEGVYNYQCLVFSAQTSSLKAQEIIESKLTKRSNNKMIPDGKKSVIFIDDLNMPKKDISGSSQPALELLRQWFDYDGWYDRQNRKLFKYILDVQFIAAMGPPSGGRNDITRRLQSKFHLLNFTFPTDNQCRRIFQSILAYRFSEFEEDIKPLADPISQATLNLFKSVSETFRSTPSTSHYVFNLRDMSKVIQGLYQINRFYCDTKVSVLRIWVHESLRVFHDRLINQEDRNKMKKLITEQLEMTLQSNMRECTNDELDDTIFIDFLDEGAKDIYQEVMYNQRDELKKATEDKLDKFNEEKKGQAMNIVLFQDALNYLCKIYRIIKLSKGHGMLIGEGGSGRHSLTKLAAYIAEYQIWQVSITKNYKLNEFREDIKRWVEEAGIKGRPGVFLFSDNEAVQEQFLEDINNILSVGEVPNLFNKDEYQSIKERIKKIYLREHGLDKDAKVSDDKLLDFFSAQQQSNFHVMLCMSKSGDNLRNYSRMYPGLVNNTTIIWFLAWPNEALVEVANKYLKDLKIDNDMKNRIAKYFGLAHTAVLQQSERMLKELKRLYYVTPTNYIELVKGYVDLLETKQNEIGSEIKKLTNGLQKLEEASSDSETLTQQLSVFNNELLNKQKECTDLLVKIQNDTMTANENQKEIEKRAYQLNIEKQQMELIAKDAQADLDKAEPILKQAEEGLSKISQTEISTIKAYQKPISEIQQVCACVMTILQRDTSWASVKKELGDPSFINQLKNYDKDNMSQNLIKRIQKYTHKSELNRTRIFSISDPAGKMWDWVLAMESYGMAYREIEPKRKKVAILLEKLKRSEEELQQMQENGEKLKKTIEDLNAQLLKFQKEQEDYKEQTTKFQIKLDNADKLLSGLASTKEGWQVRKADLDLRYEWCIGDCLISSAFLSYLGPFPSEYRDQLLKDILLKKVKSTELDIPHNKQYQFSEFLARPTDLLKWQIKGLPNDQFSSDNGVLVFKNRRYPLMIDPQLQANSWIKNMERDTKDKLIILDQQTDKFMDKIELAISNGYVVILQNLDEDIDPSVTQIFNKAIKKVAGQYMMYLGEKDIKYNPNFRFYMTTKLPNPRYMAEVSTKVTLVNFAVKEKGLEEQLVSVVIQKMEINLEKTRTELISKNAQNESLLKKLDDDILRQLQESQVQLVDDIDLIKSLQRSKVLEEETRQQIETSATAMIKTQAARENYRSLAKLGSQLYFIINDFSLLDNMYQFSLENYIYLFSQNIMQYLESSHGLSDQLKEKLDAIGEKHKQQVYKYACRGLFEKDKILLSLQMAVKLSDDIDRQEYDFFLRGDQIKSGSNHPPNPNPDWIENWEMICELDKLPNFANIVSSFVHNSKDWKRWYASATPELDSLPLEWETKCDRLRKMIILKTIRPDRVLFAVNQFVAEKIGESFVGSQQFTMDSVYKDSSKTIPVIFILAPGKDPRTQLEALAQQYNRELKNVSLGKGQEAKAKTEIMTGSQQGHWLFLANCHLSLKFLKDLEKLLEALEISKDSINDNFRLFLSTEPKPNFPITLLQKSVRVTTEPPRTIKKNMEKLYANFPDDKFSYIFNNKQNNQDKNEKMKYKKLLFSLCWFHSVIIERKKFKTLGWNIVYDFNDSDIETSEKILKIYLELATTEKGQNIQWDAVKYLISEVIYGGRVTDEWDRRLLNVYSNEMFNDRVITEKVFKLGDNSLNYLIPDEQNIKEAKLFDKVDGQGANPLYYLTKIREFPNTEKPEAFGQHINAEISSQITDTNNLISSIIYLEPQVISSGEETVEQQIGKQIILLQQQLPKDFDIWEAKDKVKPQDQNPLKIVLMQEIDRYNTLLQKVRSELETLDRGIKGLELISEELEQTMFDILNNKVPSRWKFLYHSLMPLQNWIKDLIKRVDQLNDWIDKGQPNLFWISGFSFPTGFTTALLQQSARRQMVPIDNFIWEFQFIPADTTISSQPKEGAYITGLFLEGARWDYDKNYLLDAEPMKLYYSMPIIHFKPIVSEAKAKAKKGQAFYPCPTYMYPIRTGVREKPSFMFTVQLPLKQSLNPQQDIEFWIKRGTAMLMSLTY